jgi:ATP-dependent DNA helicase RecG
MLSVPIEKLAHIGPIYQKKLKKMGIKTAGDLLFHFPHRYEDFSNIQPIAKAKINKMNCFAGKILEIKDSRTWKKKMVLTEALIEDKSGAIKVLWFNQPYLLKNLKSGDFVCLAGKVLFGNAGLYLSSPVYEKISGFEFQSTELSHTGRLVPIYPETEGFSSKWFRWILKESLQKFKTQINDSLPPNIVKEYNFLPIQEAIWQIHFPDSILQAEKARKRFSFEELFLIEVAVTKERLRINKEKAPSIPLNIEMIKKLVSSLNFALTDAQRKCAWQIIKDLEKSIPCSRLLQGDVGSGKTLVAVIAALSVVKAGWQVAFMAPTEILTKQHFKEVSKLLSQFKIRIALLTSKENKIISQKLNYKTKDGTIPEILEISRAKLLEKTKKGEIDILIGTHSLIQDKVKFAKLGLCVVDEQHRFGVEQRAKLIQKSKGLKEKILLPHFISVTATPIPRSLALTVYGNLDLSILDEMPKGRKKIITKVVLPEQRKEAYDFIRKRIEQGEQAFVICPRIEAGSKEGEESGEGEERKKKNSSWSDVKAVEEEYKKLSKEIFPELKVAMLHGKMKASEKEKIMRDFRNKKIVLLVSTSVVEVGIDIPRATVMLIEGAERFGLAQLYQFRGRIGRADLQSYCFLFSDSPFAKTRARLKALIEAKNGFELAQKDLEIRGPGSFSGVKQWGIPDLAMENLKNIALVEQTKAAAKKILQKDPELKSYPLLREKLEKFKEKIHLE